MEEKILIERLSYGSSGIGHLKSGKTVFIDKVCPGDLVTIELIDEKTRFSKGRVVEIIEASPERSTPLCEYQAHCGGCPWQQVSYPTQLEAKRQNVVAALVRTAGFSTEQAEMLIRPVKGSKREFGYRNKLELNASYNGKKGFELGLIKEASSELIAVDFCPIAQKMIEKTPKALRGALKYLQGNQDLGIFRVGIRNSLRTKDTEIALWTTPGAFPRKAVAQTLKSTAKANSIVRVIADPGKARAVKQVEVLDGKGYWDEKLGDHLFRTSAPSFFQVNTAQAESLVDEVIAGLSLDEDAVVADLYAGGGTFSCALADRVDTVFAIESASSSVRDLRRNADLNQVYIEVIGGDSARELPTLGQLDALVVDPPRAGLADGVVESIAAAGPRQVAYVSCDPSTWARDVARFTKEGYTLGLVQPIDLFPQTYHVEVVSIFEKSNRV